MYIWNSAFLFLFRMGFQFTGWSEELATEMPPLECFRVSVAQRRRKKKEHVNKALGQRSQTTPSFLSQILQWSLNYSTKSEFIKTMCQRLSYVNFLWYCGINKHILLLPVGLILHQSVGISWDMCGVVATGVQPRAKSTYGALWKRVPKLQGQGEVLCEEQCR